MLFSSAAGPLANTSPSSPVSRTLSSVSQEPFQQPPRTQSKYPCQDLENTLIGTFPFPRQVPPLPAQILNIHFPCSPVLQADLGKDTYLVTPVWPGQREAGLLQSGLRPLLLPAVSEGLSSGAEGFHLGCRVHPLLWVLTLAQETVKHKRPFLCGPTPPQNQVFDPTTCSLGAVTTYCTLAL